eukprot:3940358-Rhodomonas_salina.6
MDARKNEFIAPAHSMSVPDTSGIEGVGQEDVHDKTNASEFPEQTVCVASDAEYNRIIPMPGPICESEATCVVERPCRNRDNLVA